MIEIITTLITGFSIFTTAIIGIMSYQEKKRKQRESILLKNLIGELKPLEKSIYEQEDKIDTIHRETIENQNDIMAIRKNLEEQSVKIKENELCRLQAIIIDFANSIGNGNKTTANAFDYVCSCYDRYKKLGGNSFVDYEFAIIKQKLENINKQKEEEDV